MSAVPIFVPPVSIPRVAMPPVAIPQVRGNLGPAARSALPATTSVRWRLTDRGIAAVLLLVAVILTAAVIAIGVTALRVTSADYDADLHEPRLAQR